MSAVLYCVGWALCGMAGSTLRVAWDEHSVGLLGVGVLLYLAGLRLAWVHNPFRDW